MRKFHTKHKWHYAVLGILILITLISGAFVFGSSKQDTSADTEVIATADDDIFVYNIVHKNSNLEKIDSELEDPSDNPKESIAQTPSDDAPAGTTPDAIPLPKKSSNPATTTDPQEYEAAPEERPVKINQISVTVLINGSAFDTQIEQGTTVYELMNKLTSEGLITFKTRNFGGSLGYFVQDINGIENTNDHFWIYSINGKKATIGISNYTLKSKDTISWNYEASTL